MAEPARLSPQRPGWLILIGCAVPVIAAVGLGSFISARTPGETSASALADVPPIPRHLDATVTELGLWLSTETTFAETVTLSAPTLTAGGVEAEGELWPLDGRDHEGEDLDPLLLSAGDPVSISGLIRPSCDGRDVKVIISVVSQDSGGKTPTDRYSARSTEALVSATRQFCRQGPTVTAEMNLLHPNGDAVIGVNVVNPGPDQIRVEVPAYSDEHVTWTALTATVSAGAWERFEIRGTQVGCEPGERASWQEGRLLIDGEPFVVASSDGWC